MRLAAGDTCSEYDYNDAVRRACEKVLTHTKDKLLSFAQCKNWKGYPETCVIKVSTRSTNLDNSVADQCWRVSKVRNDEINNESVMFMPFASCYSVCCMCGEAWSTLIDDAVHQWPTRLILCLCSCHWWTFWTSLWLSKFVFSVDVTLHLRARPISLLTY